MSYAKAIAGLLTPLVLTLLVPFGITGDTTVADALYLLMTAGITGAVVYFVPNKEK